MAAWIAGSTRYSAELAAGGLQLAGNLVLLGPFLTSSCSDPVGIMQEGDMENLAGGYPGNARYTGVLVAIVTGGLALLGFFPSFWQFCPSEDLAWRWHSCLDHGSSDGAKCTGTPTASVSGATVLVVVPSLSGVQLFVTPRTAAHQASLFFSMSQSLLKLMSIELVMPSNH